MGRYCSDNWGKRTAYWHLQFCNFCCEFPLFHCQEHHIQGNIHRLQTPLSLPLVFLSLCKQICCRTLHQFQLRELQESKRWHLEYQETQQLSWGVNSWELRTHYMTIWVGIITKIATLKALWISSLETPSPYLRLASQLSRTLKSILLLLALHSRQIKHERKISLNVSYKAKRVLEAEKQLGPKETILFELNPHPLPPPHFINPNQH